MNALLHGCPDLQEETPALFCENCGEEILNGHEYYHIPYSGIYCPDCIDSFCCKYNENLD